MLKQTLEKLEFPHLLLFINMNSEGSEFINQPNYIRAILIWHNSNLSRVKNVLESGEFILLEQLMEDMTWNL
jgi:hypothetical protein